LTELKDQNKEEEKWNDGFMLLLQRGNPHYEQLKRDYEKKWGKVK